MWINKLTRKQALLLCFFLECFNVGMLWSEPAKLIGHLIGITLAVLFIWAWNHLEG